MPLTSLKYVPNDVKTLTINVSSYTDKNLQGIIENPFLTNGTAFDSTIELLFEVEKFLDSYSFPQATMAARKFVPVTTNTVSIKQKKQEVSIAKFKLAVIFRHNASWQGTLTWVEDGQQISFRSVLELIKLLDNVLDSQINGENQSKVI